MSPSRDDGETGLTTPPEEEALRRAIRFIEYRPRSAEETRARMLRWGYDMPTARLVVEYLEALGYIEDRQFARLSMGELVRKEYGICRVRSELIKKRIDRRIIDETLEEYPRESESERALEAARRWKDRSMGEDPASVRVRLVGYLRSRGYSRPVAEEACRAGIQFDTQSRAELE